MSSATALLRKAAYMQLDPRQHAEFRSLISQQEDWSKLIKAAEKAGLTNILYAHLDALEIEIPPSALLQFRALKVRQRRAHHLRSQALIEVLEEFASQGIDSLLLKGAALAHVLYATPELRPMSDIDILVRGKDAARAQQCLRDMGFYARERKPGYGYDHHHLPIASRVDHGMPISIEIHHSVLSGDATSRIDFECLNEPPLNFPLTVEDKDRDKDQNNPQNTPQDAHQDAHQDAKAKSMPRTVPAKSLGHIDMLRHLYHHTFEPVEQIKLGAVVDIYGYAEKFRDAIDWHTLNQQFPFVVNALRCLHYLTPLPYSLRDLIQPPTVAAPADVGRGFMPLTDILRRHLSRQQQIAAMLNCSDWWLHIYYGVPPEKSIYTARNLLHPLQLSKWLWRRLRARLRSSFKR